MSALPEADGALSVPPPHEAHAEDDAVYYNEESDLDDEEDEGDEEEEDEEDESEEEEEDDVDEVEEALKAFVLPPLPPLNPSTTVHGVDTSEVYKIIAQLRRQMDDPAQRERAKLMLQDQTRELQAIAQVLQESNLLYRTTVNSQGEVEDHLVPQPEAPLPSLPNGYTTWLVEHHAPPPRRYYQ